MLSLEVVVQRLQHCDLAICTLSPALKYPLSFGSCDTDPPEARLLNAELLVDEVPVAPAELGPQMVLLRFS